ncbi:MAG: transposase [Desulfobaccales bacterium]
MSWSSSSPSCSATVPGSSFSGFGRRPFAKPEIYEYCEEQRITHFIRLPANGNLMSLIGPHLNRPVGRPPKSGIQVRIVDLHYQAKSWARPRRVVAKIEWHRGELFSRIGFVVTNSRLPAAKVTRVYIGRAT